MDPARFDHLTRLLSRAGGRRAVLRALLGPFLGGTVAETVGAKKQGKDKGKGKGKDRDQDRGNGQDRDHLQAERRGKGKGKSKKNKKRKKKRGGGATTPLPADCCGTEACADPEPGSTSAGCDFAGRNFTGQDHNRSLFRGIDGRNAVFTATDNQGSIFAEACLQGASFRRARLDGSTWGKACLFDADFTGADLGGDSTLFEDALFCGTTMPDGSINDRDCDQATPCCQAALGGGDPGQRDADCADEACRSKACQNGECVYTIIADGADPSGACGAESSGHCCEGACCAPGATECNPSGLCCTPNCAGRECGPDGCGSGGTCGTGTCPAGAECDNDGQCRGTIPCTAQSYPNGCCDDNGVCRSGTSDAQCGRGGVPCVQCQAGQFCCSTPACGQLQGMCACNEDSCPDGCCENFTLCRPGTTNAACGMDGLECLTCDPDRGQVCAQIGSGEDTERVCICTPQTCLTGCCSGGPGNSGFCETDRAELCGINGALCQNCFAPNVCNAQGQCVCTPQSCPRCQTCNNDTGQCQPTVCQPLDQCHVAGTCDPGTGRCSNPTVANGTACADGNPLCINGQCCTAGHEVVHGGCFRITTSLPCTGCPAGCPCAGSIDGSGNFLCSEQSGASCTSNANCSIGQACEVDAIEC